LGISIQSTMLLFRLFSFLHSFNASKPRGIYLPQSVQAKVVVLGAHMGDFHGSCKPLSTF